MTNEQILKERWNNVDNYLEDYLKKYKKVNRKTKDKIQDIFNNLDITYSDLNKYIPINQKQRLNRFILEMREDGLLTNYFGYKARLLLNKKNVTYSEMLEIMLMGCYIEQNNDLDEYNNVLFYKICGDAYNKGIKDINPSNSEMFNMSILYDLLNVPLFNVTIETYLNSLALTNADETYKQTLINIQLNKDLNVDSVLYKDLFNKQDNRHISINDDKFSGGLVNIVDNLTNLSYLQAGIDSGTKKCRFVAEMDKRTTKMCESLNNQIFKLDEMNVYSRYSDIDKRDVIYHTKGLVQGENLPPINNHFHWCRSTISYLLDDNIAGSFGNSIKVANNYDKEQYERYKKYFGDTLEVDDVEKFVKMKYNNPDEWDYLKQNYIYAKHRYNAIQDKKLDFNISVKDYITKVHEIRQELLKYELYNGEKVKDISLHFYDRVIGNPEEKRIGVSVNDIKDTLSNMVEIKFRENGSVLIIGRNARVSYNPKKMRLITPIPGGKK